MSYIKYVGKLSTPINRKLLHTHDYWEIVRYTAGSGKVDINGRTCDFCEGDVFVIPPHCPHTDYSETGFQNYHCEFQDADFPFDGVLIMKDSETGEFLNLLTIMFNEYQQKQKNYHDLLDSMYSVLLQYITRLQEPPGMHHPYVDFAVNRIIQNYSDPFYDFSVTAAEIPFQPDYFRRIFYADMGCTPLQYLTLQRVQNAKKMLRTRKQSRLSVKEISWLSGFKDNLYFSRVFREYTGQSPTDYFKRISEEENSQE